jgi:3-phenylpropionate/cinnamic acid dioxygenase small subunit
VAQADGGDGMTPDELLYHEASLLDSRAFEEWLALYTEDSIYWIPQRDGDDPARDVSIAYEDRGRLEDRVVRLRSGFAYSQDPPSRTCHVVGNVRARSVDAGVFEVCSSLVVVEVRRDAQNIYAGPVEHTLVETSDGLRIRRKVIRLLSGDMPLGNVTFLM